MVYRVVSTKLTEEEHDALLEVCSEQGLTPSAFIKKSISDRLQVQSKREPSHDTLDNSGSSPETDSDGEPREARRVSELENLMRFINKAKRAKTND